jgi:hypothetical protein
LLIFTQSKMTSLWDDPEIQKTIALMDPKTRYEYARVGENLFRLGGPYDVITSTTNSCRTDPDNSLFETATQLKLMLRDGLDERELTDDERRVLVSVYGPDAMEAEYGITYDEPVGVNISYPYENEQSTGNGVLENTGTNQEPTQSHERVEGRGEENCGGSERLSESDGRGRHSHRRKYRNYAHAQRQENKSHVKGVQGLPNRVVH